MASTHTNGRVDDSRRAQDAPPQTARDGSSNGSDAANGSGSPDAARSARPETPEPQAQPRMWLQPFLLLSLQQWQSHGYELIRRLAMYGFEALDRGSVYRTLRQLEKDGLVSSDWDTSKDGPARRLYSLTDAGHLYLEGWAGALRGYQAMLDQFFTLYPPPGGDGADAERKDRAQ